MGLNHISDGGRINQDGSISFYKKGLLHREHAPAFMTETTSEWYFEGRLHREDGPAIVCDNGIKKWFVYGTEYNESEFKIAVRKLKLQRIKDSIEIL